MLKTYEIYFENLNEETQRDVLEFYRMETPDEGNFELIPLCILETEV